YGRPDAVRCAERTVEIGRRSCSLYSCPCYRSLLLLFKRSRSFGLFGSNSLVVSKVFSHLRQTQPRPDTWPGAHSIFIHFVFSCLQDSCSRESLFANSSLRDLAVVPGLIITNSFRSPSASI